MTKLVDETANIDESQRKEEGKEGKDGRWHCTNSREAKY